jgi:2-polyprenyl-3-methyl-5-hydroxy-6-metoxy-1,4-benzoquinol methylase
MTDTQSPDFPEFNNETAPVWERLAGYWDDTIGEGNGFQDYLVEPYSEMLLELKSGERVLDIACGGGRFTRRMAAHEVTILAIDHSAEFIERAKRRTTENADKIDYRVINATDKTALLGLGKNEFDAAVCTMALMDMASITPLISALPELLKPGGRFVFSILHPAFHSGEIEFFAESGSADGKLSTISGVKITRYAEAYHYLGKGILAQPEPQHYFHRPLNMLFQTCFKYGFVLDGLEEPQLPEELDSSKSSPLSWLKKRSIPPLMISRMRLK